MCLNWQVSGLVLLALLLSSPPLSSPFTQIRPGGPISGFGDFVRFIFGTADRPGSGFFPPNFSRFDVYLQQMLVTVGMGLWGTVLPLFLAVPLSFMGAQNVAPEWRYGAA